MRNKLLQILIITFLLSIPTHIMGMDSSYIFSLKVMGISLFCSSIVIWLCNLYVDLEMENYYD